MNNCGVLELLSSLTALTDWKIADSEGIEPIDKNIYDQAEHITLQAKEILNSKKTSDLRLQSDLLRVSGDLTVQYGCGRPVSGSEHILSALIENKYRCAHGVALAIAIPLALRLQLAVGYKEIADGFSEDLVKINPFRDYIVANMDKTFLKKVLMKVTPRKDRFTVIDKVTKSQLREIINKTVDDLFV